MLKTVCALARWRRSRSVLITDFLQHQSFGSCVIYLYIFYLCLSNGRDIGNGADARRESNGGMNNTGTEEVFFFPVSQNIVTFIQKNREGISQIARSLI